MSNPSAINKAHTSQAPLSNHGIHFTVGTLQGFAAASVSIPTGLLTAAFLSRVLEPVNYGILSVAVSIVVWIEGAITVGFGRAAEKLVAEAENWRSVSTCLIQAQFLVSLGAALGLTALAPVLALWLQAGELTTHLRILSVAIPLSALCSLYQSILVGRGWFGRRALLMTFYWLGRMALIFLVVWWRPSITSAILAMICNSFLLFLITLLFINPPVFFRSHFSFRDMLVFTLPLFCYAVGTSLFNRLDLLFVKGLSGSPQDAGYYGAIQNLTMVPALFMASLVPLLLSKLAGLRSQGHVESARAILQKTLRLTFCLLPFGGLAAGSAVEIVVAIYGQAFHPAGWILAVLVFGALGMCMTAVSTSALVAAGRPQFSLYLTAPLVISAAGAHCIFVPAFGTIGAACVTTALSWLSAGACLAAVRRYWNVGLPPFTVLRSITICLLALVLAANWQAPGPLLLVKLPAISLLILFGPFLLGELKADEVAFIRSMLRVETGGV